MNRQRPEKTTYTMQEIGERTGLSADTLRFYEKDGVLSDVFRLPNGHRRYDPADLDWLNFVVCLRTTGMPLKDIRRFRELLEEGDESIPERLQLLLDQKESLLESIGELERALRKIEHKIAYYEGRGPADCEGV